MLSGTPGGRNEAFSPPPRRTQNTRAWAKAPVTRLRWRTNLTISRQHKVAAGNTIWVIGFRPLDGMLAGPYNPCLGSPSRWQKAGVQEREVATDTTARSGE